MSKNKFYFLHVRRNQLRHLLGFILLSVTAFLAACVYVPPAPQAAAEDFLPFSVRDGGKSKVVYAPPQLYLEDEYVTIVCTGRPTMVRILSVPGRRVLVKIPIENAVPKQDGWHATFPLFEGLSAFFTPGQTFLVSCWGANGTDGSTMPVTAYYTHAQFLNAEED